MVEAVCQRARNIPRTPPLVYFAELLSKLPTICTRRGRSHETKMDSGGKSTVRRRLRASITGRMCPPPSCPAQQFSARHATRPALLGLFGHTVAVALDGASALAAAKQFSADVFILDIGLPDIDGFELAARIRAQPKFAAAKLIALTEYGQSSDRVRGKDAGFDRYFVKPVNIEELTMALGN